RNPQLFVSLRQQATAWQEGVVVSPVIVYDQVTSERLLRQIITQIEQPARDASLQISGLSAVTTPGQIGRQVDVPATLAALGEQVVTLKSGEVSIVVVEHEPAIVNADAAAQTINTILATQMEVYIAEPQAGDPGPWYASQEALAQMIIIEQTSPDENGKAEYTVRLSEAQLQAFLDPLKAELARTPSDARFHFDDAAGQLVAIVPSADGRDLNIGASIQAINQVAVSGQHSAALVFDLLEPAFKDTVTGEELGIVQMVSSATTYFAGSGEARRNNIRTAASRFDGIIIRPGEEFSFNHYLGDVSEDTGFDEALVIFNGRTIPGVGGGVCQVSTTAFQAAFYAGFPIVERYPHGYRVGYYEVGEGAGMDATVYSPVVDMKFVNDTPYHLLVETEMSDSQSQLTFRFYSTSDGRTVQKDGPYITNRVPHGPAVYEENPELTPGQVKKVDYAVDGADVTIYRIVYRAGEVLHQDTFFSQYIPWQDVYQVAPGYLPRN
ncbi:MAG: VanW family protein, partial [Anaerolineae bacterium]|nr:VanW family protein [Anaerolineae bacterium]